MSISPISSTSTPAVSLQTTTAQTTTAQTSTAAQAAKKLKLAHAKLQTDTANKADPATLKADKAAIAPT